MADYKILKFFDRIISQLRCKNYLSYNPTLSTKAQSSKCVHIQGVFPCGIKRYIGVWLQGVTESKPAFSWLY